MHSKTEIPIQMSYSADPAPNSFTKGITLEDYMKNLEGENMDD